MPYSTYSPPRSFVLAILVVLGPACGGADVSPDTLGAARCEADGLCITKDTPTLLSGGYRSGELELDFDVAYRPSVISMLNRGQLYCTRMVKNMKQQWYMLDNSNCPEEWLKFRSSWVDDGTAAKYMEMAKAFRDEVDAKQAPPDRADIWKELRDMAHVTALDVTPPPADATGVERVSGDGAQTSQIVLSKLANDSLAGPDASEEVADHANSTALSSGGGSSDRTPR